MPHLHLPAEHTDADLVLAANLADIVGSEDLFVAWTHRSGAGAIPEIDAFVRDERPHPLAHPFAHLIASVVSGAMAIWQGLTQPSARPATPAAREHA
jgi:hypothetical protein